MGEFRVYRVKAVLKYYTLYFDGCAIFLAGSKIERENELSTRHNHSAYIRYEVRLTNFCRC